MSAPRTRVAASFWSTPRDRVAAEADRLARAGLRTVHWDHTDGRYAAAGGFTAAEAAAVTAGSGLGAEAHLMVEEPLNEVDRWTDFCELVVVHAGTRDWRAALDRVRARGARAGVALSPGVEAPEVEPGTDVLVMSITPGEAGSTFQVDALTIVGQVTGPGHAVGLDGGVTRAIVPRALHAGATWLVSGTDLVASEDPHGWLAAARATGVAPRRDGDEGAG
jgi:ribulose-phosphate 3-epimerase